jgi:hypothetical protein
MVHILAASRPARPFIDQHAPTENRGVVPVRTELTDEEVDHYRDTLDDGAGDPLLWRA